MSPLKRFLGTRVFPVILFVLGALALYAGIDNVVKGYASQDWPATKGVVTAATMETTTSSSGAGSSRSGTTTYHPSVTYDYSVNAISYSGYTISFGGFSTTDRGKADTYLERFPEGLEVTVYYNPGDHGESVLEPGLHDYPWIFIIPGVIFVLASIFLVRFFPRGRSRT